MQLLQTVVLFAALCVPVSAQSFLADGDALLFQSGREYVRFEKGKWSAGIEGGPVVRWHMFLWHDQWVYETLPGGEVRSGPTLENDGAITMSGVFSARENSAPVKYAYRITPEEGRVCVRCELEKTGPLELRNGVWLHVGVAGDRLDRTNRVWIRPASYGTIASSVSGVGDGLLMEVERGRAVCLAARGLHEVNTEGTKDYTLLRYNVLRSEFPPGEKAVVEYTISFAPMPEKLPGQIEPAREPLAIKKATPSADRIPQYEKLELAVDLGATYANPYDPEQVALDAVFTAPSGKRQIVPGFFLVDCRREVVEGAEMMVPEGNGAWRVRFAPLEKGRYQWRLRLRDRSGEITGGEGAFEATAPDRSGFVRRSNVDPHYLAFDDGRGYFAIGHNLPIYHTTGQLGDEAVRKFAAAKENFNRWWMCSYGFGIEGAEKLGWYRQDSAARIDLVLDVARELGLYYMMCMDTHQDFREAGWEKNPFSAKNGGPCASPRDWFTDETARSLYRKRLRYTVARWGYSSNVLCWEFGNEMEGWADSPDSVKLPWHREMSDYLRSIDPFQHLITTSFWSKTGPEAYWQLPNIDIVQTHCYTNDDGNVAEAVRGYCLHQWERFEKPHIFGEFGIRSHSSTADKDPEGRAIHNGLWAGLFNFAAGGPMPWWHENYIEPLDLYFHFTALANFADGLPLGEAAWKPLSTASIEFVDKDRQPETRDTVVLPDGRWGKPEHNEFHMVRDGTIAEGRQPHALLHGDGHADLKNPPTFVVDYPAPGKFVVRVGTVSHSGLLRFRIDDRQILDRELPCAEGLGKKSVFRPQWKLWETTYDEDIAIDVPAGRHRIRVENLGRDWVRVASYVMTGCSVLDKPNVLVCGMKSDGVAMLWVQNRDSSWVNHARGTVPPVAAFAVTATDLPDGKYRLQWWETWRGTIERTEPVEVRGGRLSVGIPELKTDIAIKVLPDKSAKD